MSDKVLMIGGAKNQCHGIDILQKLGKKVIVADYDENCLGAKKADIFYNISTLNIDELYEVALSHKVIAVMSMQSDSGMLTATEISCRLGLKSNSLDIAKLFTDKSRMRDFLKKGGFLCPSYKKCTSDADVISFAENYGYPFVMKPLNSQGSRGVTVINNKEQIPLIEDIAQYNREIKGVMVEEYLGEDEYTVEGIVISGKHFTLAISQKKHYKNLKSVSNELFYSWEPEYNQLIYHHNNMMESTGIQYGVTHSEYIKNKRGFVLVEFAARGGGSMIASHIVPAVSGCDVENLFIRNLLSMEVEVPCLSKNCAVLKFIELKEKVIKHIEGLEKIKKIPNILNIELKYVEGQLVQPVLNDTNRHGFYIAWAKTKEELISIMQQVQDILKIEYYD